MIKQVLVCGCCLSALSGCASDGMSSVQTTVTSFHRIEAGTVVGKKLAIIPITDMQSDQNLEYVTYRDIISRKLGERGLVIVSDPMEADWVGSIIYLIDGGQERSDVVSVPQFGMTGGGTTFYSGNVSGAGGYGTYSGTASTMPTFGVTGYSAQTVRSVTYTRKIGLEIYDISKPGQEKPTKLYEAVAVSKGRCNSLAGVFESMAGALAGDWPGENGKAKTVTVPQKLAC